MKENKLELNELLENIRKKFRIKENPLDQICFSLIYWQRGLWSIKVTDDWHKWMDKGIEFPSYLYETPEEACISFLKFLEQNKIDVRKLQSRKWSRKKK